MQIQLFAKAADSAQENQLIMRSVKLEIWNFENHKMRWRGQYVSSVRRYVRARPGARAKACQLP